MNEEIRIIEKLRKIEALFAGATTAGEKDAAASALERMQKRFKEIQDIDPPIEYKFSLSDPWSRKLFVALLRRYGIKPFRYYRQRRTTVMANISASFVDETLWPEFQELNKTLREYLDEVTNNIISKSVHSNNTEAEVVKQLTEE
ncbi:MAG: hypothetical protein K8R67_11550 [Desulfobacteraceae bacterium]|nr:hypothetical protein [Desulfobacteraceae bacterium]